MFWRNQLELFLWKAKIQAEKILESILEEEGEESETEPPQTSQTPQNLQQQLNPAVRGGHRGFKRGRSKGRRRGGRSSFRQSGETDPYDMSIVPLNINENQVIPVGLHNLSKSFRPNLSTIRVLSMGTKI